MRAPTTVAVALRAAAHIDRLVYFERYADVRVAIARERQITRWTRAKKIALIESVNPGWADLGETCAHPEQDPSTSLRMTGSTGSVSAVASVAGAGIETLAGER